MRQAIAALLGLAVTGFAAPAAACNATLVVPNASIDIRTSPSFDSASARERFDVIVRNDGASDCRVEIGLGIDPAFAGEFPPYSITGAGGVAQFDAQTPQTQAGTSTLRTVIDVEAGSERSLPYDVAAQIGWELAAGNYLRRVLFTLSDAESSQIIDEDFVDLNVEIPLTSRLDFIGAVNRLSLGRVAFGEETVSPPFGMRIYSTSSYTIDIESENNGSLIREQGDAYLPYEMRLNGQLLNLATVDTVTSSSRADLLGDIYSIIVSVRAETNQRAGSYSDRVTVTVTPF